MQTNIKDLLSKTILISLDMVAVFVSIYLAYFFRVALDKHFFVMHSQPLAHYLDFSLIYLATFTMLAYEGSYTRRYDFWHESRQVLKAISFAFLIILSYLAMTKSVGEYSRAVVIFTFLLMAILIPLFKNIGKKQLFRLGIWQREAKVYGNDPFLIEEIFRNPYLGYIEVIRKEPKTVFINSKGTNTQELRRIIGQEIRNKHEVVFIPLIDEYDLTQSHIYELSNTRTNLIVFQNRLKSRYRVLMQQVFNYILAILLLPVLLPIIAILAFLIKRESPGPVFFAHNRIGQDGRIIPTLKFRSMYSDAKERLEKLLAEDEEIKKEWETNFKLKNDPRVTKIGAFLRKTSLDELPQIFNVLKGEMNFVGPRPVIQQEIDQYYKDDAEYYFMVKPGITGLWQVSGRSDTDYDFRVATDKWYVSNWSLWLDIVILFKTVKVVLFREGAY
ncbi:undecaprenyl-phosphate galactose phosphotransferase WbaP [Sulfurovum sp. TSL6]|uniref:exopolysaccharide biosynthesis polyprenyl glycosylphosphotransferase n=1 Tax=Sulfurovum sp. TSL6 TaxID=2826995 RepID=UPI001CC442BE|nr:exopolysaccharide biosynthesis polyprenyl glycosylphosphotransferase [Sulfurovum sp. TSL6]GIU00849.1 undecaprenyl-phosphate galactose phosphotransferase WbaP [Sulfurovum sp. TSL6]